MLPRVFDRFLGAFLKFAKALGDHVDAMVSWLQNPLRLRGERFGFLLIGCSLVVIALICAMSVRSELTSREERNRAQGVSLARVLASLDYAELVPGPGREGPLEVMRTSQTNPDFVYGVVVDPAGGLRAQVTARGFAPAPFAPPAAAASWNGERIVDDPVTGGRIREFYAPVIESGERVAHVRVGFLEPTWDVFLGQASVLGMLALPIFLLTPLAYFLIRRGLRPLVSASAELNELVQSRRFDNVRLEASGEVGEFIQGFNRFMDLARSRIGELEQERSGIVASSKVVAYQKARVEAVLETLPDATLVLDETGSVMFANAKLEPVLGVAAEDAMGGRPEDWCGDANVRALLAGSGTRDRSTHQPVELPGGEDGSRVVMVDTHPIRSDPAGNESAGTLVVLRDVTEETSAKQTQSEFVSHVAHELKSPLNVMAMYGESLLEEEAASEEYRIEASNVIRDEVERLASLVSALLGIAQIETGAVALERQRIRLEEYLADAVEAVSRPARGKNLSFRLEVPKDVGPVFVDKELFRVAVNNLLTNAIKYNREDGEVAVIVTEGQGRLRIQVRDTGIGIAEEDLPHLFDKFYRSEDPEARKRGGHGLGLSLAREIVELHGGSLRVASVPESGSEFTIELRRRAGE